MAPSARGDRPRAGREFRPRAGAKTTWGEMPPEPHGRSAAPASGASRRAGESKAKVLVHQQSPMSWVSSVDRGLDATRPTMFGFGQNGNSALMSATDKAKNKIDDVTGQAKEKFGEATNDRETKNEGKVEQTKANLKDAGEKVKDAFKH